MALKKQRLCFAVTCFSFGFLVHIKVGCVGIPNGLTVRVVGWNDTVGKVEALTGPLENVTGNITEATCSMVIPTGNTTFMAQVLMPEE